MVYSSIDCWLVLCTGGIGAMGLHLGVGSREELKLLADISEPRAAIVAVIKNDIQILKEILARNPSVVSSLHFILNDC